MKIMCYDTIIDRFRSNASLGISYLRYVLIVDVLAGKEAVRGDVHTRSLII